MHRYLSKNSYRLLQKFRGEPVFDVLKEINSTQWLPVEELRDLQWKRLSKLIAFTYNEVPFYREHFRSQGISPEDIRSFEDFKQLPFLTKNDIREEAERLSTPDSEIQYTVANTSGSTGTPLSIKMSQESWAYHHANIIRAFEWHKLDYFSREGRIGGQSTKFKKRILSGITNFICNRIYLPANNMNDKELRKFLRKIKRFRPTFLYGYPTAIYQLCRFIRDHDYNRDGLKIAFTVCHGEELEEFQRAFIQDTLNCRVVNCYGAGEVGIIAYECPEGSMHIPVESIYVELVEPEDGVVGGVKEIVVTDLHSYAMPLLRYRIGDLGVLSQWECSCGRKLPCFSLIKGKIRDFIETPDGRRVHTVLFNSIFKDLISIGGLVEQWQIIEKAPSRFVMNIVNKTDLNERHLSFLMGRFHKYLGTEVDVKIARVERIGKHPSGKFRAFIREWK